MKLQRAPDHHGGHNANLVMGPTQSWLFVANRHRADRKNHGDRTFEYFEGAQAFPDSKRSEPGNARALRHPRACLRIPRQEAGGLQAPEYKIRAAGGASGC